MILSSSFRNDCSLHAEPGIAVDNIKHRRLYKIINLNIILNGDSSLSEQRNLALHTAVSKYILETNRF